MTTATSIGTYPLPGGTQKIDFFRDESDAQSFSAVVMGLDNGTWVEISKLESGNIKLVMRKTAEEVDDFFSSPSEAPVLEANMADLPSEKQDVCLGKLEARTFKIIVTRDGPAANTKFEHVTRLLITPSEKSPSN